MKTKYHAWVIRNKDLGEFVYSRGEYTKDLDKADLFRTRQLARDSIHDNDTVEQEMAMKVLLLNDKRFLINESSQLYLTFK